MIQVPNSSLPPGTIGYITSGSARYEDFYVALETTQVPQGTALSRNSSYNAAENRNTLIPGIEGDWIWFLDDDHVWESSALMRLLKHDVDIVVPIYCKRYNPFQPTIFKQFRPPNQSVLYTWQELSELRGLIPIEASGCGGMLVKKHVLDALEPPHFRVGAGNGPEFADLKPDLMLEDQGFCWRARQAGFKIHCDLNVSFGHIRQSVLVPKRKLDGNFGVFADLSAVDERFSVWLL
jgi:hypothetical protein